MEFRKISGFSIVLLIAFVLLFILAAPFPLNECIAKEGEKYCGFWKFISEFQTLIAGCLAIAAAWIAFRGAKEQASSILEAATKQANAALEGANVQSLSSIKLDRQRREDLKQGIAASTKVIAHELNFLMKRCQKTADEYKKEEEQGQETDPLIYQDCIRSLKISTHKLLPTDMATLALLDTSIGRRTAILYSRIARYEFLIEECM